MIEVKYPDGIRFKIQKLDGVSSQWKFVKGGTCLNDCKCQGFLAVGEEATLRLLENPSRRFQYYLEFDSGLESDYLSEGEVEILMEPERVCNFKKNYVRPPFGVLPKHIKEAKNIKRIIKNLNTYSQINDGYSFNAMIKASVELTKELQNLESYYSKIK